MDQNQHWEKIYSTKQPGEVSWTQEIPLTSLSFIHSFHLPHTASIIDIGGGESRLVDYLLDEGFDDITVLDISATALQKAQERLGEKAQRVNWIISDITAFEPARQYDVWHDRAAFHFLVTGEQIERYLHTAANAVTSFMTIGTFSENGPEKCSGLPVRRYSEMALQLQLSAAFDKVRCLKEDHITPFETHQEFLFCSFKKKREE
jgi:hypothetical protein